MLQSAKDEFHRKTLENIDKYGLAVQYVFDNEENFQFRVVSNLPASRNYYDWVKAGVDAYYN